MNKVVSQLNEWSVTAFDSIDSTNTYAKRLVKEGVVQKTVIVAERQTGGYGRSQKNWESFNNKGLWMTAILPVSMDVEKLSQSTLVLAVAVQKAVEQVLGKSLQIKWPNDLLSDGKKCAGLLVEFLPNEDRTTVNQPLILGIGLNVNQTQTDFSASLSNIATSLRMLAGHVIDKQAVLKAILEAIEIYFAMWQTQGFSKIHHAWLEHSCSIGREVNLPDRQISGHVVGLAKSGALQVKTFEGTVLEVNSGEVFFKNVS